MYQSMPSLDMLCNGYKGSEFHFVHYPKLLGEPDGKVVHISGISMYLLCKFLRCWF